MKDPLSIFFVTWHDGKLFEGSQTSIGEDHALALAVQTWLIPQFFSGLRLGGRWGGGALYHLWPAMEKAGSAISPWKMPTPRRRSRLDTTRKPFLGHRHALS